MANLTTTFFILFALISISVMDVVVKVGAEVDIDAITPIEKAKRCHIGLGYCKNGVDDCKYLCRYRYPDSNPEGYCWTIPGLPLECYCAFNC
ncbi:hypothetical protein CASFOL_020079 [Castilleja foliolosa]|uniref:Uncharacterized protein n=1 Tax=Castilleja foliolosa TaxID=1961234 RepID=A0ABD3D0N4_9LAMI